MRGQGRGPLHSHSHTHTYTYGIGCNVAPSKDTSASLTSERRGETLWSLKGHFENPAVSKAAAGGLIMKRRDCISARLSRRGKVRGGGDARAGKVWRRAAAILKRPEWESEAARLGRRGIKTACIPYLQVCAALHVPDQCAVTFAQNYFYFILFFSQREETTSRIVHHAT